MAKTSKKRLEASGPLFFLSIPYKNQSETALQSLLRRLPYVFTSNAGRAVKGFKMRYRGVAKIGRCFVAFATVKTSKNFADNVQAAVDGVRNWYNGLPGLRIERVYRANGNRWEVCDCWD